MKPGNIPENLIPKHNTSTQVNKVPPRQFVVEFTFCIKIFRRWRNYPIASLTLFSP